MRLLVLGGTGRLYGAIVGTAIFMIAQDVLAGRDPVYWQFWLGLFLVAFVLFARGGVLGSKLFVPGSVPSVSKDA